jgi:hypothetical protein
MSDDRKLPSRITGETRDALHNTGTNSGRLINLAAQNLTEDELKAIRSKALDEKIRLEVLAIEREQKYVIGRRNAQDHIDTFAMLEKGGRLTSNKVKSEIETGSGKMTIESKSGATCFVASAAYDDPNHPDVMYLRGFRDKVLAQNSAGRIFISLYWKIGPTLAIPVKRYATLRSIARGAIGWTIACLKRREG